MSTQGSFRPILVDFLCTCMIYMGIPCDDLLTLITCRVTGDGPSRYSIDVDCEIADIVGDSGGKTQEEV